MWTSLLVKSFVAQARPGRYRPPESCAETLPLTQAGLWPQVGFTSWCSRLWQPHAETSGVSCSKRMTPLPHFLYLISLHPLFVLPKKTPVPAPRSLLSSSVLRITTQVQVQVLMIPAGVSMRVSLPQLPTAWVTLWEQPCPRALLRHSQWHFLAWAPYLPLKAPTTGTLSSPSTPQPASPVQSSVSLSCPWPHKAAASTLLP